MTISPADAWAVARLLADQSLNGELDTLPEPLKAMAQHLAGLGKKARPAAWQAMLAARPERDELVKALEGIDPLSPAPPAATAAPFATLADVAKIVSAQPWLWRGWLALGVLNAVAADPGVGKTRFALDLARRLWFGLPWPDGQPATLPAHTRTLWIQGDRNFAEMLQAARDFELPDEAVALGSSPDDPFGSLDLDDHATLAALGVRIQAAAVPLAIIDTVGMTTSRNLSRPDEAREFFAPIMDLCHKTGVALLGLTHLSKDKEALGRRIVEKARVVIKMTQPDPEGQPDRRRLWVDKTAIVKPPALGISMGTAGNEYDFNPPKEVELIPKKRGPVPEKLEECKKWMTERLTPNPAMVKDVRRDAEQANFSPTTLYGARDALGVEEYTLERRKWWKLPLVAIVGDSTSANSDNSDKAA
jgi:AAA domain